jgi:hypothetical protein
VNGHRSIGTECQAKFWRRPDLLVSPDHSDIT